MKKNIMIFLSVTFMLVTLLIPNKAFAVANSQLVIDWNNENFQDFYNTYLGNGKLEQLKNTCYSSLDTDSILIEYGYYGSYGVAFTCYDIKNLDLSSYVKNFSSESYLSINATFLNGASNYKMQSYNITNFTSINSVSNGSGREPFIYAFETSSSNRYEPRFFNFLTNNDSSIKIPFYTDKAIRFDDQTGNQAGNLLSFSSFDGFFQFVSYGDYYYLYDEPSFLPSDFNYLSYDYSDNKSNIILNIDIPYLPDNIPYSFYYDCYLMKPGNSIHYNLNNLKIVIDEDNIENYKNTLFLNQIYTRYSDATYYFKIYAGNSAESSALLQELIVEPDPEDPYNNPFIEDNYYDYYDKDNTSNFFGNTLFGNFNFPDYGLSAIITAPLRIYNSFSSGTCTEPVIPILGTNFTLPCGNTFWDNPKVNDFKNLYKTIIYGLLCYYMGLDIYRTIMNVKNPNDTRINTIDL